MCLMPLMHLGHRRTTIAHAHRIWTRAGETMAEYFCEGLLQRLTDTHDPVSRALLKKCVFFVIPNMCPDGELNSNLNAALP